MIKKTSIFLFLILLVPALLAAAPAQVSATVQGAASVFVSGPDGVTKPMELKATKDGEGPKPIEDFQLTADNVVSTPLNGKLRIFGDVNVEFTGAKLTPAANPTNTIDVPIGGGEISFEGMYSGVYTLDVIVGNNAYECIVVVGQAPQQLITNQITEINTQSSNVVKVFEKGTQTTTPGPSPIPEPDEDELSVCYFHPNTDPHCKPVNGECPEDAPNMNEQGNCHPSGCPDGFSMLDDDESGTCYSDKNVIVCPGSNAKVLRQEDCAIYEPDALAANDTSSQEQEPEQSSDDNNDTSTEEEEPLTSNCGGQPCSASEKEDSWLSEKPESSPGVPIDETTDTEETEPEDDQPEQQ
jgi:hypothetical protein